MAGLIGTSVKRREDPALITGKGRFTDDIAPKHLTYAAIVRSPHAHARVNSIDTSAAAALPGVVGVYTLADMQALGISGKIPTAWLLPDIKVPEHTSLASDTVRYVGHAVAVVVAEDRSVARDAADLVAVDYTPLPAAVDPEKATREGAPQIWPDIPNNTSFDWKWGDAEKTEAAFATAPHKVEIRLRNNRLIPHAIEPRAALGEWDEAKGELTITLTSQNPHVHRLLMSLASLGLPEHKLRIRAPDVGGGFGSKIHLYADETIVGFCAMKTGRPVKWTATRSETNLTDAHGRDHVTLAEIALNGDGKIQGLRVHTYAAMGAYLSTFGPAIPTILYGTLLSGQYDIPAIFVQVWGVFTNTAPVDAYRGAGRPEATFVVERLLDRAAHELGLDPAELRRRNFIAADRFPFLTAAGLLYDSGNYAVALERALEKAGYTELRAEQAERRQADATRNGNGKKLLGIGLSSYIEACGLAPSQVAGALGAQAGLWESAKVRVHPTGSVTVFTGSCPHGQGHDTTFSQIAADKLGIGMEKIDIVHGDTGLVQFGMGTYGSRSAAVGASALAVTLDKVVEKGKQIAAHLLEAAPDDITYEDGQFSVKGVPGRSKSFGDVALQAYLAHNMPEGVDPGLEMTSFYNPSNFVFPFGTHVAVVEIDAETGEVKIVRYVAVDDCGNVINPMIVDGQVHGGVAQGIGQALWEEAVYDDNGQLLTGEMLDYALPRAHNLPHFELDRTVTPCPHNPLGVKGIGEAGAIASPAAVTNAVVDALKPYGITHLDMPLTPEKVWRAIHSQEGRA